jgi:hypothetical protein
MVSTALAVFALGAGAVPVQAVYPANGTFMGAVHFSVQCVSGIGVGVAFDGTYLWYSCYRSGATPDLLRASPITGLVTASYDIDNGLGAIAYDAGRNAIWAAPGGGSTAGAIWLIKLDATQSVASSAVQFTAAADTGFLDDGLGYDGTNDTLYFKPDNSNPIHHYKTNGTKLADINGYPSCFGPATSGLAIGGNLLFEGKNGCSHVFVVDKTTLALQFDFSTAVAADPNFRDEGLTCDTKTFAPVEVMWSKEAYTPMRASAFSIPAGTCGIGGQPADDAISGQPVSVSATEGQKFSGNVATFTDPDQKATAAEYTATINWGDGSPTEPGVVSGGAPTSPGKFTVSGSHTYAEEGGYKITVVITDADNPGNTATVVSPASVADAALKSACAMPPFSAQTYTGPTAGFSDANSGPHPEDFPSANLTINWGDGTTTNGTLAGANPYTVNGSHTYTSTGTFTVTTTITDVGGSQTVATCTVTVFAFATSKGAAFVVGDLTVPPANLSLNAYFWGSKWDQMNPMSGPGPSPSAMKGFAGFEDNFLGLPPPVCGGTWSTDTGNSTPPPPTIPAVMGVIVSSNVTQSGSVITGNIVHVVIVKTNPGYAPNPGSPGTGKILGFLC